MNIQVPQKHLYRIRSNYTASLHSSRKKRNAPIERLTESAGKPSQKNLWINTNDFHTMSNRIASTPGDGQFESK